VSISKAIQPRTDQSGQELLFHASPQKTKEQKYGRRTDVRHFTEEVKNIEILPGAKYTLFCLETKIYVYARNSKDLYDIIPCSNPIVCSAITTSLNEKALIAFLEPGSDGESVNIRDYGVQADCTYQIKQPFGWGYKVGGLQLEAGGRRICVVSADGCYVYIYGVEDFQPDTEPNTDFEEDQLLDTYGDENPYLLMEHNKKTVEITHPIQKFQRGSSTCKEIYMPI